MGFEGDSGAATKKPVRKSTRTRKAKKDDDTAA